MWWLVTLPGLTIVLIVLCINFVGDGLRDALDPDPAMTCLSRSSRSRTSLSSSTTEDGVVHAVDGISYDVNPGETLGIVGESGSGKSVSMLSILGLIPQPPGKIVDGEAHFKGRDLLTMPRASSGASAGRTSRWCSRIR